ncbi:protein phosphatase 2C domain-containing protein [Streptomyces sp. NPDC058052]|uniref:protein phosphatase 2C domain-containing protein n=1 Tax=Streptomyces sp. NPDC058052 TaxID=3346316 RepID=UPI0036DFC4B9
MAGKVGAGLGLAAGAVAGYVVREAVKALASRNEDEQAVARPASEGGSPAGPATTWPPPPARPPHATGVSGAVPPAVVPPGATGVRSGAGRAQAPPGPAGRSLVPPKAVPACPPPPVIYQASQLTALPWRLPTHPAPPGMAADAARLGDLEVRAASLVGTGHRVDAEHAVPRQDAYRLGRDAASQHLVVAVADGMSDSVHSDTAAAVAALALVNALRAQLDEGVPLRGLDHASAFLEAARQVHTVARQRQWPDDSVRTVAAVAVVPTAPSPGGGRDVWIAGLGDTTAWVRRPRSWSRELGEKQQGFDAGRLHAYLPHTPEAAQGRHVRLQPGEALALTTDGVGDALTELPAAQELFHRQWAAPVQPIDLLLHIAYDSHQRNDDRTAVVVWPPSPEGGQR